MLYEITPLTIFYGSMLGIILAALFVIMYRQGRSPTHNDMQGMERHLNETIRQARDDLKREITESNNACHQRRKWLRLPPTPTARSASSDTISTADAAHGTSNRRAPPGFHRMMNALANYEHVNGRVVVTVQPDAEPVPTAADD